MGIRAVTVGQLNNYISRVLKTDPILSNVSVKGEISNLKFHGSGHVYFSLKDESSKVNCFLSSSVLETINAPLEEGLEIIATGNISVYLRGGYYSLNVRNVQVSGEGQLSVKFEQLKKALECEGLFDPKYKKPLPTFPERIAVVTSSTGAAVRDIIRTISEKNSYVDILVCPVTVQGPVAAKEISSMIDYINENRKDVDIIITGRGGGSMEELWAFNEEIVARSIYASGIPVISAVGHETDFTISDFAADFRAATPTGAAEMAAPDTRQLAQYVSDLKLSMTVDAAKKIDNLKDKVEGLSPEAFARNLSDRIMYEQVNIERMRDSMTESIKNLVMRLNQKAEVFKAEISASDPAIPLRRGYALIRDAGGKPVTDVLKLKPEDKVMIESGRGYASAKVTEVGEKQ